MEDAVPLNSMENELLSLQAAIRKEKEKVDRRILMMVINGADVSEVFS